MIHKIGRIIRINVAYVFKGQYIFRNSIYVASLALAKKKMSAIDL
jgi:hypothetical protein